jgi:hypothetical protein
MINPHMSQDSCFTLLKSAKIRILRNEFFCDGINDLLNLNTLI